MAQKSKTYAELTDELEKVMQDLEGGDLDIDAAVTCYERGLVIVGELEAHLRDAENRVTQLKAVTIKGIADDLADSESTV